MNVSTYFLYLDFNRNPIEFNCELPEWLYYDVLLKNPELPYGEFKRFTTIRAVYEPVTRRTLLMWIMFGCYCIIFLAEGWIPWLIFIKPFNKLDKTNRRKVNKPRFSHVTFHQRSRFWKFFFQIYLLKLFESKI